MSRADVALHLADTYREEYRRRQDIIHWIDEALLDIARMNKHAGETLFMRQRRLVARNNRLAEVIIRLEEYARCDGNASRHGPSEPL